MAVAARRNETAESLLDAAERLLVTVGHAGLTTRRLAAEARINAGLVHYYFGSVEEVFLQVLDRFTDRLIARQRAMYAAEGPFLEKWQTAWRFQEEDLASGYNKIWLELQAMAWNRPELRARVARVNGEWRAVLREAFARALREYGLDERAWPVDVLSALVMTMGQGYQLERLSGIDAGHAALLDWIEQWLASCEKGKRNHGARTEQTRARGSAPRSARRRRR